GLIEADHRHVNSFLDTCVFDVLSVHLFPNQWLSPRICELIAKAEIGVGLFINRFVPTPVQFMTLFRPVTFHFGKGFSKVWTPDKDENFLELLRRGHSFPQLSIKI
ncbi:hypothetical protein PENTCL1PPCAC_3492, partial [Pristionchus entomophagus]